jgi:hypothetical protein
MEQVNKFGFPTMNCDYCDKLVTNDNSLVIDNSLQYHGECWEELKKHFPKVLTEGGEINL